jgi:NAD(P)-dependent dehydrogenase (short-subunit alcohol dehydrogenase family)
LRFLKEGWKVIGTGRRKERLAELVRDAGGAFLPLSFDVSAGRQLRRLSLPSPKLSNRYTCWSVNAPPAEAGRAFTDQQRRFYVGPPRFARRFFSAGRQTPSLGIEARFQVHAKAFEKTRKPLSHTSAVVRAHTIIAGRYGIEYPYILRHYPKSMTKRSAVALWDAFLHEIRATLNAPFRSPSDVSVTMLYPLYAMAEGMGKARIINGAAQVLDCISGKGVAHIGASIGDNNAAEKMKEVRWFRPRSFCFNDAPGASDADRATLREFLAEMFPDQCKYEILGA